MLLKEPFFGRTYLDESDLQVILVVFEPDQEFGEVIVPIRPGILVLEVDVEHTLVRDIHDGSRRRSVGML